MPVIINIFCCAGMVLKFSLSVKSAKSLSILCNFQRAIWKYTPFSEIQVLIHVWQNYSKLHIFTALYVYILDPVQLD